MSLEHPMAQRSPAARNRREGERGFVLLALLFASAAIAIQVAILLPQAAMQAQRVREERLIYRGKQYKRAIELYFRKHQKYPKELDDLEDTNGVRYLRRRYKDPLTGEDEWRLIHMGPDGRFKDSLIYDQEELEQGQLAGQPGSRGGFGGQAAGSRMGGSSMMFNQTGSRRSASGYQQSGAYNPNQPYNPNRPYDPSRPYDPNSGQPQSFTSPDGTFRGADRARAVRQSTAPVIPGLVGPQGQGAAVDPSDPNAVGPDGQPLDPNQPQYPDYSRTLPSQVPPGAGQRRPAGRNQPGAYGQGAGGIGGRGLAGNRSQRGQQRSGAGGFGQPGRNQPGGFGGARGGQPGGFGAQGAGSQAASIIGNLLTQPRPGGLAGLRGAGRQQMQGSGPGMTGGIAGVASKVEERGVKVYEGREYFNEWEFVFDYREAQAEGMAAMGGMAGMGGGMMGGQPGMTANPNLSITPGGVGVPGGAGARGGNAYPPGYPTFGQPGAQPGPGTQRRRPDPNDRPGGRRSPYRNLQPGSSGYDPNNPTRNPSPNLPGLNQPGFNQPGRNQRGRPGYGQPRSGQPYGAQPGNPFPGVPGPNQRRGGSRQQQVPGIPGFPNQQQAQPRGGNSRRR